MGFVPSTGSGTAWVGSGTVLGLWDRKYVLRVLSLSKHSSLPLYTNSCIYGDDTMLVGQERVDVHLLDLRGETE